MTNWQTFKVLGVQEYQWCGSRSGLGFSIALDKHVEFSDGYKKGINAGSVGGKILVLFDVDVLKSHT